MLAIVICLANQYLFQPLDQKCYCGYLLHSLQWLSDAITLQKSLSRNYPGGVRICSILAHTL